jgi:hypothetical protein
MSDLIELDERKDSQIHAKLCWDREADTLVLVMHDASGFYVASVPRAEGLEALAHPYCYCTEEPTEAPPVWPVTHAGFSGNQEGRTYA